MSAHAVYVMSAYLVALIILGGLVISSIAARQRVRRELSARGLDRKR